MFVLLLIMMLTLGPAPSLAQMPPYAVFNSYAPIVKKVAPAVVSIATVKRVNMPSPLFGDDPFFNFFFGGNLNTEDSPGERFSNSLGSGVIVHPEGIVVTCGHVVDQAKKIIVRLNDNREFEGKVIAKDKQNDLVAIRLTGVPAQFPLPFIALEKGKVEVGDAVLTIGDPFNVGQTVTSGIISAIARNVGGRILLQTDAPINPGNSGGALISMNGNLIGIPNAILSKTGASHGIGFAIPEALIQILLDSIPNGGVIIRPWAGIEVQRLTVDLAVTLGLPTPQGVLVTSLHPLSPAQAAGLTQGDVLTTLNGEGISTPEEFLYRIQSIPLNQPITLTLQRNGQIHQTTFTPIKPPAIPAPEQQRIPENGDLLAGVEVANLSPALASQYQLPAGTPEKGVLITDVGNNVMALRLRLQPGAIIAELNQQRIESVAHLLAALPTLQRQGILVIRQGDRRIEVKKRP